jgi:hypothetical protein
VADSSAEMSAQVGQRHVRGTCSRPALTEGPPITLSSITALEDIGARGRSGKHLERHAKNHAASARVIV